MGLRRANRRESRRGNRREETVEATVEQTVGPAGRRQNRKKTVEAKSRRGNRREIDRINRRSREIYRVNEV